MSLKFDEGLVCFLVCSESQYIVIVCISVHLSDCPFCSVSSSFHFLAGNWLLSFQDGNHVHVTLNDILSTYPLVADLYNP